MILMSCLAVVPSTHAAERTLADADCNCGPVSAIVDRGHVQRNARVDDPAEATFGGFAVAFPGSPAVVSGTVNGPGEEEAVTIYILAFGFGVLSTEVTDCCIQGDLFQTDWAQTGPGGTLNGFEQNLSPQTAIFNLNIAFIALVKVDV